MGQIAHGVQIREVGTRRWYWINSKGEGVTRLIHATRMSANDALAFVEKQAPLSPELDMRVMAFGGGK